MISDMISRGIFVSLNVYFIRTHNKEIKKRCKGGPAYYVEKSFDMDIYRNCIVEIQFHERNCWQFAR
jgi:Na+/alanine symporter